MTATGPGFRIETVSGLKGELVAYLQTSPDTTGGGAYGVAVVKREAGPVEPGDRAYSFHDLDTAADGTHFASHGEYDLTLSTALSRLAEAMTARRLRIGSGR
jgi:hypothetical protein